MVRVGLVDITGFKWYNDALDTQSADRIIERVAALLREQVRSGRPPRPGAPPVRAPKDLHARFGGDEFCFLIPDLPSATRRTPLGSGSAKRSNVRLDARGIGVSPFNRSGVDVAWCAYGSGGGLSGASSRDAWPPTSYSVPTS